MSKLAVVILAAGEGTRMRSSRSKVLHHLAGKPLVRWVLSAVAETKPSAVTLIVGHKREQVMEELGAEKISFVWQKEQRGSGHALIQAGKQLKNFQGDVLVLCGDTPLIKGDTLRAFIAFHRSHRNDATVLSADFEDPFGYGRIVRFPDGRVQGIVEEKDAVPEQRAIREINSGIYCFKSPLLWKALKKISPNNVKKEYYLTDVIGILNNMKKKTGACNAVTAEEIMGVNTRRDLAAAEAVVRARVLDALMRDGVTIIDPRATYVGADVRVGQDTIIYPGTVIEGRTEIGAGCVIGPSSYILDSRIGDNTEVRASHVIESETAAGIKVGPFSHLRPGSVPAIAREGQVARPKKKQTK